MVEEGSTVVENGPDVIRGMDRRRIKPVRMKRSQTRESSTLSSEDFYEDKP